MTASTTVPISENDVRDAVSSASPAESTLVYYAPLDPGGLAHYAIEQIRALAEIGIRVMVVGSAEVVEATTDAAALGSIVLKRPDRRSPSRLRRALEYARTSRRDAKVLATAVRRLGRPAVLISAFVEYFSPIWAPQMRKIHQRGVKIGVVVHDPIRDFQAGPKWWHAWSVSQAYSFVDVAFTHGASEIDTGWPARAPRMAEVFHGFRDVPTEAGRNDRSTLRQQLEIPQEAPVFLMFGHLRDGKNLDLVLQALRDTPHAYLLVVGKEQSSAQKPVTFYQKLADELGVSDRCRWVHKFVADEDVAQYFQASDVLVLSYSRAFRSTSGVIAVASQFGLRVIASGGDGPLGPSIQRYKLGSWCEPDSADALRRAMREQLDSLVVADWDAYRADHSWHVNAWTCATELGLRPAVDSKLAAGRLSDSRRPS